MRQSAAKVFIVPGSTTIDHPQTWDSRVPPKLMRAVNPGREQSNGKRETPLHSGEDIV